MSEKQINIYLPFATVDTLAVIFMKFAGEISWANLEVFEDDDYRDMILLKLYEVVEGDPDTEVYMNFYIEQNTGDIKAWNIGVKGYGSEKARKLVEKAAKKAAEIQNLTLGSWGLGLHLKEFIENLLNELSSERS